MEPLPDEHAEPVGEPGPVRAAGPAAASPHPFPLSAAMRHRRRLTAHLAAAIGLAAAGWGVNRLAAVADDAEAQLQPAWDAGRAAGYHYARGEATGAGAAAEEPCAGT